MIVLYLFHYSNMVLLPFYAYDRPLWRRVFDTKSAKWNSVSRCFVFQNTQNLNLERLFAGYAFVEVGKSPKIPLSIGNFFKKRVDLSDEPQEYSTVKNFFGVENENKLTIALHARKYSPKTIKLYLAFNRNLCNYAKKSPESITFDEAQAYIAYLDNDRGLAASSMNLAVSAIKFFYCEILNVDIARNLSRPRGDKKLPPVLSKDEIKRLFSAISNRKHRLLLALAYSAGLRVAELVRIRVPDLDFERKTVLVRSGKGRKDRYTLLSAKISEALRAFCRDLRGTDWVFAGSPASKHLSERSAQHIFEKALQKSGIIKSASIHSLRHSFATHLLESGTDISYIKELLGHSSIRTTERYTHIARRTVLNIKSPLDSL